MRTYDVRVKYSPGTLAVVKLATEEQVRTICQELIDGKVIELWVKEFQS